MPPCADFVPWFRVQCGVLRQLCCMRASLEEQEVQCRALRVISVNIIFRNIPYLSTWVEF